MIQKKSIVKNSGIGEKVIIILLIAAIVLSVLSIALTWKFDTGEGFFSKNIKEGANPDSAGVGLTVQGTAANTKNG